jgi:hypothetical protein
MIWEARIDKTNHPGASPRRKGIQGRLGRFNKKSSFDIHFILMLFPFCTYDADQSVRFDYPLLSPVISQCLVSADRLFLFDFC